jgi:hypothetical protein
MSDHLSAILETTTAERPATGCNSSSAVDLTDLPENRHAIWAPRDDSDPAVS